MSIYLVIESYTRVQQSLISVGVVMWVNKQGGNIAPHGGTTLWQGTFHIIEEGYLSEQYADRPRRSLGSSP